MRIASIDDIKNELKNLPPKQVLELTLRLARFKKENKELLTYLLFEAHDQEGYVQLIKADTTEQFAEVIPKPVGKAKKSYRKILRGINRHVKYMGSKAVAAELLLHYCKTMRGIDNQLNPGLSSIYQSQLVKVEKLIPQIDEDLQFEFSRQLEALREEVPTRNPIKKFFRYRRSSS